MTVGRIEEQARVILLDTYEDSYRFAPKEMFVALKQGIAEVHRLRPESRYVDCRLVDFNITVPPTFTDETLSQFRATEIQMDEFYEHALVCFVVYKMYLKDDTDTQNAELAKNYLTMFGNEIQ